MSSSSAAATGTNARSEFEGSIKIFSILIGIALILKIVIQGAQSRKPGLDPSIPTQDNPTGTSSSSINGQADTTLGTYGWCLFWMVCMWVTVVAVLSRRYLSSQLNSNELNVLFYSIPYLFSIVLVIWTIVQTNTYSRKINTNQVPTSYLAFSIGSTVLLGFMMVLIHVLSVKIMTCTKSEESIAIILAWLAISLGLGVVGMTVQTEVLLTSYTTDG
jgi:hypothetical protein